MNQNSWFVKLFLLLESLMFKMTRRIRTYWYVYKYIFLKEAVEKTKLTGHILLSFHQLNAIIVTLFSTPENGIILLDQFPEEENYTGIIILLQYYMRNVRLQLFRIKFLRFISFLGFLGVQVPYLYFAVKVSLRSILGKE